jgi:hypothetical protein
MTIDETNSPHWVKLFSVEPLRGAIASKICISYRRDDSAGTAGRLHDRLAERFGHNNLFIDVDNMPAGADFVDYLGKQVANCDIFLCAIGPRWIEDRTMWVGAN